MENRLLLHEELLEFLANVYFQPPSDLVMKYPCIVYTKAGKDITRANNHIYNSIQEYQLTIMDYNPDNDLTDRILNHFEYSTPGSTFVVNRLNHSTIKLYY